MKYLDQKLTAVYLCLIVGQLLLSCKNDDNKNRFESNTSYSDIDEKCKIIANEFDLSIIYYFYNSSELRTEYKVLGKRNQLWTKLLFYSDIKGNFQMEKREQLSEQEGVIAISSLNQYDLFDITPEDILLKEHKKLCGKPRDPSHYLQYNLALISGRNVRSVNFSNPKGRYEMCPAIRQWDNAGKISDFFEREWDKD